MHRFIIDTQLPPQLAAWLNTQNLDAIHTTSFPNGHLLTDATIRKVAIEEKHIIITKDSDFYEHFLAKGAPPSVLLLQFGNIRNDDLLYHIEQALPNITTLFSSSANLIILDRVQLIAY
ncbi:MAG TPA: DUF5615 family PIN-like protein [Saprospiraceae bacterium]|nr:DUF5615 family PIN-like protein [Saprospiraceae bacterium]HMP13635.1 DUF5615 family PIN-like protein [Saprospiraceae bacterium]